jgi:hypothetical protein
MADYIPSNDAVFNQWFKFMNQYVAQKCGGSTPEWNHIPQAARTGMENAYISWYTAYSAFLGPHTPVDTEAKNDAKKAAKKVIRPFVNQYLRYPPVTDEDRTAMGIPNRDTTRSPYTITFEEEERGKSVYIALRWQNKKGKKGPFTVIQSAIIP